MNIVDVTLRDGGFTCDFDWPIEFAQEYYNLVTQLGVSCIELGYWKQSSKSQNRFFNLDFNTVKQITGGQGKNNSCVMIDYHYCSKDLNDYPTDNQNEIQMIRMTARKDMIDDAFEFGVRLKQHTGLAIAFNIFNTTNYTDDELNLVLDKVVESDFDIIGFADTHGHLNLNKDILKYEQKFKRIKESGKKTSFHLHNHTGQALMNYIKCSESAYIDICDTSIGGLGKGAGNLKLEEVVAATDSFLLCDFIHHHYNTLFKKTVPPYFMITGRVGITDNYATQAMKLNVPMDVFVKFCITIEGLYRDNFDKTLLENYIK
tara:strand:- start:1273 stop:2223 length:951 start_codon:yes stop_codon:yes gene_type:complete